MTTEPDDHDLALAIATEAGQALRDLQRTLGFSAGADHLRQEGDRVAHELIVELLRATRPHDAVLSEEGDDDTDRRLNAERCWIVDPLDGTREYGQPGDPDWAVHVALVVDHWPVAGAVALPAHGAGGLAFGTGVPPMVPPRADGDTGGPVFVVSRSRPPAFAHRVVQALDGSLRQVGSAGAKAMAVVRGEADVYLHDGGQYEWDSAAPVAVATASGLHTSRIDGSALVYNRPDPYLPDLLICRAELADAVLTAIRDAR